MPRLSFASAVGLGALLAAVPSCADVEGKSNAPPRGALYFPSAVASLPLIAADPGARFALVVSANADRRYSTGWMSVVDVNALETASEPAAAVLSQLTLPSFGGRVALSSVTALAEGDTLLAVTTHRGDGLLSIVEVSVAGDVPRLSCGDADATVGLTATERRTDCDRRHLIALDDPALLAAFGEGLDPNDFVDPYALAFVPDSAGRAERLVVSFLSHTALSNTKLLVFRVEATATGETPFFTPERVVELGEAGIGDVVVRPSPQGCAPGDPACDVYVAATTRVYSRGSELGVVYSLALDDEDAPPSAANISSVAGGTDLGGIAFAPDGTHAFVTINGPDGLVALDASLSTVVRDSLGGPVRLVRPSYGVLGVAPLVGRPAGLVYLERGELDLVAVAAFDVDEVLLVAAAGGALVPGVRLGGVGDGPFSLATARDPDGHDLVLLGTYLDHGLTLVRIPAGDVPGAVVVARVRDPDVR